MMATRLETARTRRATCQAGLSTLALGRAIMTNPSVLECEYG